MKIFQLLILLVCLSTAYTANCQIEHVSTDTNKNSSSTYLLDTLYWENKTIQEIKLVEVTKFSKIPSGLIERYDSLGRLLFKGQMKKQDEIKCLYCYVKKDSIWQKQDIAQFTLKFTQVGVWEFYHSNGLLESKGSFSGFVKETQGKSVAFENHTLLGNATVYDGWFKTEYLKEGKWFYYDNSGKLIRKEEYVNGILVFTIGC